MEAIEAIYQNGVFRPLAPVPEEIIEGQTVHLTLHDKETSADEIMRLAENFYEGLSEEEIEEIGRVANKPEYLLSDLLNSVTNTNLHQEVSYGDIVGRGNP